MDGDNISETRNNRKHDTSPSTNQHPGTSERPEKKSPTSRTIEGNLGLYITNISSQITRGIYTRKTIQLLKYIGWTPLRTYIQHMNQEENTIIATTETTEQVLEAILQTHYKWSTALDRQIQLSGIWDMNVTTEVTP